MAPRHRPHRPSTRKAILLGAAAILALTALASASHAGAIDEWVDSAGRTHVADTVPLIYRGVARAIDSGQSELSAKERDQATKQAEKLKADAARVTVPTPAASAGVRPAAMAAGARKGASAPVGASTDCVAWRRRFALSRDCFAGFLLADGSLRPGAFQTCGDDVPNPEPACGTGAWR